MSINKRNSARRLAMSGAIVCALAVPSSIRAAEAALPSTPSSPSVSVAQNRTELTAMLPKNVALYYLPTLASLYESNQMQPLWQDNRAIFQFQRQLAELAISGAQPQFAQWVELLADPTISGMVRDVVLSDAMLGYLQFVSSIGSNGNNWLYGNLPSKLDVPTNEVIAEWLSAIHHGNTLTYINSLAPQHPQYAKMQQTLHEVLADLRPWPQIANIPSLLPGQLSEEVPTLRDILIRTGETETVAGNSSIQLNEQQAGATQEEAKKQHQLASAHSSASSPALGNTVSIAANRYTDNLVEAVKRFQRGHGLTPDGVIGNRTRMWLNVSHEMRAALLALNMQRLRILPAYVDTAIMVNIPNYSLNYYLDGREVLSSKVIVGTEKRKTPLMSSALSNVVVNPPWNVPAKLVREDILPKIMRDRDYLEKYGYRIFSNASRDAELINPAMINWGRLSARNFPYHLQQQPGASNSLGRFKFNMPSSDAIYLHDTPHHELFQKDIRALSSGCVRVNKALDLGKMLLHDAGWDDARVSSTLAQGDTRSVRVHKPIPVKLYYLTAWISENGQPQFRTDIYGYDVMAKSGIPILGQARNLMEHQTDI